MHHRLTAVYKEMHDEKENEAKQKKNVGATTNQLFLLTVHKAIKEKQHCDPEIEQSSLLLQGDMNNYRHENKQNTRAHKNSKPSQH